MTIGRPRRPFQDTDRVTALATEVTIQFGRLPACGSVKWIGRGRDLTKLAVRARLQRSC